MNVQAFDVCAGSVTKDMVCAPLTGKLTLTKNQLQRVVEKATSGAESVWLQTQDEKIVLQVFFGKANGDVPFQIENYVTGYGAGIPTSRLDLGIVKNELTVKEDGTPVSMTEWMVFMMAVLRLTVEGRSYPNQNELLDIAKELGLNQEMSELFTKRSMEASNDEEKKYFSDLAKKYKGE